MKNLLTVSLFQHVSHVDRMLFTKHLAVMLTSGITIFEAVQILITQTRSDVFRRVLTRIRADLENGKLLSEAFEKHPHVFNQFYISLIQVGEETGKLSENLTYLAEHMSKEYAFQKKVKGAMIYPMIVLVFATVVGLALSLFVLPNLVKLFEDLDVTLSLSTRLLLGFSVLIRDHGVLLFLGIFLVIFLFRTIISLGSVKPKWHAFLLAIPFFGDMIRNVQLTSFCRNIGIMLQSGLTITKALEVEQRATNNIVFKEYLKKLLASLTKGKSLADELSAGKYRNFPLIAVKMIAVGEKTGKLDETLLYLGNFFEEEVDDATKNISTIIEPILLLGIGLIVAFVAFAIISPIYEFTGSVKR